MIFQIIFLKTLVNSVDAKTEWMASVVIDAKFVIDIARDKVVLR